MSAVFRDIEPTLTARNLRVPDLRALRPDAQLYEVIAIQPSGSVAIEPTMAAPDFVGHRDRAQADAKFRTFLEIARHFESDLAISPEYSFPWEVLSSAISSGQLPTTGRLWILGCEAITPTNLRLVIANCPQVEWISEDIPNGPGRFLNVLAYVFETTTLNGERKLVALLQFKHEPMGGNTFERDNLILGRAVYILHNDPDNIRLMSLLCSDALTFNPGAVNGQCRFDLHPYLILHLQLNPKPLHVDFSMYRGGLFSRNTSSIEVVALNWARGFVLPGTDPALYGGSALYTKSAQCRFEDDRIEANHLRGLHFTYWASRRTALFLFNFDEHVFRYRIPKVFQDVPAVEAARTGPEMLSAMRWEPADARWVDSTVDDGFGALCASLDPGCNYFDAAPHTAMDRERLVMLSTGTLRAVNNAKDWHHATNLLSIEAESDERSKRLTFSHEMAPSSVQFRREHLGKYIELQSALIANAGNLPTNIRDLAGDIRMSPPVHATGYRFNLESISGTKAPATGVFLGLSSPALAAQDLDRITKFFGGKDRSRRLVVWYRKGDGSLHHAVPTTPSIDEDAEPATSILRETTP